MKREELGDLMAFLAVVEERSFTRAAARLGKSQSSVSHIVRRLEDRLGVVLLTRTTRSVSPTDAGEHLARTLRPAFDDIEEGLARLDALRNRPTGTIRLTTSARAAQDIVLPVADRLMAEHPDVRFELTVDQTLVDIAREGYDAGIRLGEQVDKDMVAVRIGPDARMVVAGAPAYFQRRPRPKNPKDLTDHVCINLRLPTWGGLYTWEFERAGRSINVRVAGQFTCNDPALAVAAALRGRGLLCLPNDHLDPFLEDGRLVQVLERWCPPFPGYHLYYPSRRQVSPALRLLVDALRYDGRASRP